MSWPARGRAIVAGAIIIACSACSHGPAIEAVSLFGEPLYPPTIAQAEAARLRADLRAARRAARMRPNSEDAAIWHGRRLARLGRFQDAIDVYTRAIERHDASYRLRSHRGRAYLTIREFELAERDLERAAELAEGFEPTLEPDASPNALGVPRTTTHWNIFHHLGVTRFLMGDLEGALKAHRTAMGFARANDDMLCATTYWLYLTLRRLGRAEEASAVLEGIGPDMEAVEFTEHLRLLLMFKGVVPEGEILAEAVRAEGVSAARLLYGVGMHHLLAGRSVRARVLFEAAVAQSPWPSLAHLAAAAELRRLAPEAGDE